MWKQSTCISLPLPEARSGAQRPPSPVQTLPLPSRVNVHGGCTSVRVAFGPHGSSRCHGRERLSSPPPYPGVKFQAAEKAEVSRLLRSENPGPRESGVGTGGGARTHRAHRSPRRCPEHRPEGVQVRIRCENIKNPWNCSFWIYPDQNEVTAKSTCLKASVPEGSVMCTASGGGCPGAFPAAPEVWAPPLHPLAPRHRSCTACVA